MGDCGQKWAWDSNFNEWTNLAEFLHASTYSRKLKITLIVIGWAWSHIRCVILGHRTLLSSALSQWMNELSWFFTCSYMVSGKLKVTLGMHMVKYGCDLLGPVSLKSALSQLKNKSMNWADFLHAGSDGIIFG